MMFVCSFISTLYHSCLAIGIISDFFTTRNAPFLLSIPYSPIASFMILYAPWNCFHEKWIFVCFYYFNFYSPTLLTDENKVLSSRRKVAKREKIIFWGKCLTKAFNISRRKMGQSFTCHVFKVSPVSELHRQVEKLEITNRSKQACLSFSV